MGCRVDCPDFSSLRKKWDHPDKGRLVWVSSFVAGALTVGEFFGEVFPDGFLDARDNAFQQVNFFEAFLVLGC